MSLVGLFGHLSFPTGSDEDFDGEVPVLVLGPPDAGGGAVDHVRLDESRPRCGACVGC